MKGTKVKCRDCKYARGEGKLLWCDRRDAVVKPYWTGCVMGNNEKEANDGN